MDTGGLEIWDDEDTWGEPTKDAGNSAHLRPWRASPRSNSAQERLSSTVATVTSPIRSKKDKRPHAAVVKEAPSNLANRVKQRTIQASKIAEENDQDSWKGPYCFCKDDTFADGLSSEQDVPFLLTKRLESPPKTEGQILGHRVSNGDSTSDNQDGGPSASPASTSKTFATLSNLRLYNERNEDTKSEDFTRSSLGKLGSQLALSGEAMKLPSSVNPRTPQRLSKDEPNEKPRDFVNDTAGGRETSLEECLTVPRTDGHQYVLNGDGFAISRTWLQESMDRTQRGHEREIMHAEAARASKSPLKGADIERDRYALGHQRYENLETPVAAGIFVQPVVLERLKDREKDFEREKERGSIVQGSAMTMESSTYTQSPSVLKESRLRTLLKEAKERQAKRAAVSSPSLCASNLNTSCRDEKITSDAPPGIKEECSKPEKESSVSVSSMDVSVVPKKGGGASGKTKRLAKERQHDPFALVRLEEHRTGRMELTTNQALTAPAVAKTSIATTILQTKLSPQSKLLGHSFASSQEALTPARSGVPKKASGQGAVVPGQLEVESEMASTGAARGSPDLNTSRHMSTPHSSLMRESPSRLTLTKHEYQQVMQHQDFCTVKAIADAQRTFDEEVKTEEHKESSDTTTTPPSDFGGPRMEKTKEPEQGRGAREEPLVMGKLPLAEVHRCRKGPTDQELQKEVTSYLIKTESAREKFKQAQDEVETRRLDAILLGEEDGNILHDAVAAGVEGNSKPTLIRAPDPGLKLKRERTYLGTKKAHSISIDLTTLQGQKSYIRDTKISQAQTENVKPEKPLSQEQKNPINLPDTTTTEIDGGRDKEDTISRAASLHKSVPRVGTVKRVARRKPALPASPSSTMSANTRTRPHSATAFKNEDELELSKSASSTRKPLARPASAPPKRAVEPSEPTVLHPKASVESSRNDVLPTVKEKDGDRLKPAFDNKDDAPSDRPLSRVAASSRQEYVPMVRTAEDASDMSAQLLQTQYDENQWRMKRKLMREIQEAGWNWNSGERRSVRLSRIVALGRDRQDLQSKLYEVSTGLRTLVEREVNDHTDKPRALMLPSPSSDPNQRDPKKSDAGFRSFLHSSICADHSNISEHNVKGEEWVPMETKPPDDYLYIRLLASKMDHRQHRFQNDLSDDDVFSDNPPENGESAKDEGQMQGGPCTSPLRQRSMSPARMSGRQSPLGTGSPHRSNSPLRRSQMEETSASIVPEEGRQVRESQEAIIQILGLPSAAERAEQAREQMAAPLAKVKMVVKSVPQKNRRHAPVVFRSRYGLMTNNFLSRHEERATMEDSWRNKGLSTPFGLPMQAVGCTPEDTMLRNEEQVAIIVYRDLDPVLTWDGLHTTCSVGKVHHELDHAELPHSFVYTFDMAKTNGPMHKSQHGLSTRLLMVLLVNFEGDASLSITPNRQSTLRHFDAANSWQATHYWGTLADAGFDPNNECFAPWLKGRTVQQAWCVIISPGDPRYVNSHKIDLEMVLAADLEAAEQAGDLEALVNKRKEIEDAQSRGVQLADESVFEITVTGLVSTCDFALLTRTIFLNDLPNPKLSKYISENVKQNEKIFHTIKTSIRSSELRLRFGQHGVSIRKSQDSELRNSKRLRELVNEVLFRPLRESIVKGLAKRKIHWDSLEATLRKKLVLREDSETTLAPEESMAEAEAELFHVWSCFVAVNSADSSHKTMRFEHFYMLLFFIGLVASPDFENSLGFPEKRMLLSSNDVEVTWEKVYPLKGRTVARMDFEGCQRFFRLTSRRLKITLSEIFHYPNTHTNKGNPNEELLRKPMGTPCIPQAACSSVVPSNTDAGGKTPSDPSFTPPTSLLRSSAPDNAKSASLSACVSASPAPGDPSAGEQTARLKTDGTIAQASLRKHPCWLGTFSSTGRSAADESGYVMQPLALEDDFLCVETLGFHGIERSTNLSEALSMNPPAPSVIQRGRDGKAAQMDSSAVPGESRMVSSASAGDSTSKIQEEVRPDHMSRMSSSMSNKLGSKRTSSAGVGCQRRASSQSFFSRANSAQSGEVWEQEGGKWSARNESLVRMLRMKKYLEYFSPDVPPEDPLKCTPHLELLGSGPVFFRRNFLLGTEAYAWRVREEWAATKIQARVRGMAIRKLVRQGQGVFAPKPTP